MAFEKVEKSIPIKKRIFATNLNQFYYKGVVVECCCSLLWKLIFNSNMPREQYI